MICLTCNQEYDDNQACPNCAQQQNNDQNTGKPPLENPSVTTSPPDDDQEKNPPGDQEINVRNSKFNAGRDIKVYLNAFDKADESHKGEEEKSIWEFVQPLTPRAERHYRPSQADLQKMVASLMEDQVVLISSSYDEFAVDAAWAVIEAMPNSSDRYNGTLAFEDTIDKTVEFSPQNLLEQKPETDIEGEVVLLVDAFQSQANKFPNSILGNYSRYEATKRDLKNSKLFLVVVVNHEYAIEKKLLQNRTYRSFSYWDIPFLEPFFRKWFEEDYERLLAALAKQRAKWEDDEASFTQQVLNYYHSDRLVEVIDNGGPGDPDSSAETMLKTACPVEKTVLYTATFFNEITSPEFCRVVESLLGTRTTLKDAPNISANGATPTTTRIEVPLRRIWDEEKDEIFTKLLVETSNSTDSPRTVSLSEFNLAEPLRKRFEKYHRFYLIDQFKALQQTGIFFYPSLRLAKNTTQLAVDLAHLYPDEFNENWIVMMARRIKEYFAERTRTEDPMFTFLPNTEPGANRAFARVSEICQRFLESPQQKSVVPNSLEYMIGNKFEKEVLWLIKQLKFNSEFDDWYWLKQLLNRADPKTKYQTYYYIVSYLKQLGTRVYDGLKKLESWLSPADRPEPTEVDTFIFRILIKYCLDTINSFNDKHYGRWPSRYALFTLTDAETAKSRFTSLANCLLHPGVDRTLVSLNIDGSRITLIAVLLAEWSFILLGTPSVPRKPAKNGKESQRNDGVENCTAPQMFALLLKQFLSRLDSQQHLELLKYWTELNSALFIAGHSHSLDNDLRNEMKWKNPLVQRLIRELQLTPPAKPARTSSGAMVTGSRA